MAISFKNYTTAVSKTLQKKAEKLVVRECDETEKQAFVAYVDEGDESFDVMLRFSPDNEVVEHSCECKEQAFCSHRTALLIHLANGAKIKTNVKAKKKESKAELLLQEVKADDLKKWVADLLARQKDLELSFINHFSAAQQQLTPADAVRLTKDAIKAVIGNKKTVDPTQLKKLVDLWAEVHKPVVQAYLAAPADAGAFESFNTVIESCLQLNAKINTSSNRIVKYIDGLLQQTVLSINELENEKAWEEAVGRLVVQMQPQETVVQLYYVKHLIHIFNISPEGRKRKLLSAMVATYKNARVESMFNGKQYTIMFFDMLEKAGVVTDHLNLFEPIRFDNAFNSKLIRLLMAKGDLEMAKRYCLQQMEKNFREEYDLPYLQLLNEIYTLQQDEEGRAKVLAALLPQTYNLDDYNFIVGHMAEEERKKFRTKMMTRARHAASSYNTAANNFYFALLHQEKNYKKMIDAISSRTPYATVLQYLEPMALTDKGRLLKVILDKSDDYGWGLFHEQMEEDQQTFQGLLKALLQHFDADFLRQAINKAESTVFHYRDNGFVVFMKEQLGHK